MADGRWSITNEEVDRVIGGYTIRELEKLPNYGRHKKIDDRNGNAPKRCAFCGSENVECGLGGSVKGAVYNTIRCIDCGGSTDLVCSDDNHVFF